mmetsp:Transcript_20675/g.43297  ORF Transcript_20675/g.43297 Transcript_20675/m.43297 type:complete len:200 (+) Transcript_20675:284-883(+)
MTPKQEEVVANPYGTISNEKRPVQDRRTTVAPLDRRPRHQQDADKHNPQQEHPLLQLEAIVPATAMKMPGREIALVPLDADEVAEDEPVVEAAVEHRRVKRRIAQRLRVQLGHNNSQHIPPHRREPQTLVHPTLHHRLLRTRHRRPIDRQQPHHHHRRHKFRLTEGRLSKVTMMISEDYENSKLMMSLTSSRKNLVCSD